jgi:uncharacterized repeat protein (TIGR01451 family)
MKQLLKSALVALACIATPFAAADKLDSVLEVFVVLTDEKDGEKVETLVQAGEAEPGDVLEYVATYTNVSDGGLSGFNIKLPVPANTNFIAETANASVSSDFVVSIDGGKTFEETPVTREVVKNGKKETVVIPPEEYEVLAWKVADVLKPKTAMTMRYRVLIQ